MTTYYVASDGDNYGNGSSSQPWRQINHAIRQAEPGDTIIVKSGTYNESVVISKDGTPSNYITVRSEEPGGAKIVPPEGQPGININSDYVRVMGFDVSGSTTTGITGTEVHHVEIIENIVHDNVSNGIFLGKGDYWLIERNVVYGNAASGGSSGIHLKAAHNITGNTTDTDFRIVIRDNVTYENERQYGAKTDGNGIILDDFRNTQITELPAYKLKTLIEGNITYSNTGRGIQVAWSDYATIRDNIAFHNNADARSGLWRGELSNMGSHDNTWIGNIAVSNSAEADNPSIANVTFKGSISSANVNWIDNLTFNGTVGDPSVYTNFGNTAPDPTTNQLGVDPGLTMAEVIELGWEVAAADPDNYIADPDDEPDPEIVYNLIGGTGGNDVLIGTPGHDSMVGGNGNDALSGNNGHDILNGGNGIDTMEGGAGNDTFVFGHHSAASTGDVIVDFEEGDIIDLAAIDANIKTNAPGDQDFTYIGAANFSGRAGELRYIDGVLAGDVNGDGNRDFYITLANGYALGIDDFLGVSEEDIGEPGDPEDPDPIIYNMMGGTSGNDTMIGSETHDSMVGGNGNDSMVGNGGQDILNGGNGIDTMEGGAGNDTYVFGHHSTANAGDYIVDFDAGDLIDLSAIDANIKTNAPGDQDFIYIGAGAFTGRAGELRYIDGVLAGDVNGDGSRDFFITLVNGYALSMEDFVGVAEEDIGEPGEPEDPDPVLTYNMIGGTSGNDTLLGTVAHDSMVGGNGNDSMVGNDGHDILNGGNGIDTMTGGAGNDTYVFGHHSAANAGDVIVDFEAGDLLDLATIDANIKTNAPGDQDFIYIGAGAFTGRAGELRYVDGVLAGDVNGDGSRDFFITLVNGYALSMEDFIGVAEEDIGEPGEPEDPDPVLTYNMIGGTSGNDTLLGTAAHDSMVGGNGNDSIVGNDGHDILNGGNGIDTLTGGAGNDTFLFGHHSAANAGDVIVDFETGDVLDLAAMDANIKANAPGDQDFTFIGAGAFSGVAGELRYVDGVLAGDVNGDGNRDFFITFSNGYALGMDDFVGVASEVLGEVEDGEPESPDPVKTYNKIGGTTGNDILTGTAAHDSMVGGNGHDSMSGEGGDDILVGGNGIDTLTGGEGADTFVYAHHSTANTGDVIVDFEKGDLIDFAAMDANIKANAPGDQAFTYIGATGFSSTAGELRYADGVLEGDVNGDGTRDFFVTMANAYALAETDFVL